MCGALFVLFMFCSYFCRNGKSGGQTMPYVQQPKGNGCASEAKTKGRKDSAICLNKTKVKEYIVISLNNNEMEVWNITINKYLPYKRQSTMWHLHYITISWYLLDAVWHRIAICIMRWKIYAIWHKIVICNMRGTIYAIWHKIVICARWSEQGSLQASACKICLACKTCSAMIPATEKVSITFEDFRRNILIWQIWNIFLNHLCWEGAGFSR